MLISLIVLGFLIFIGNERQRAAIDGLRREAENWSINDLRLKRGTMVHSTDVKDPIQWLRNATSKALGTPVHLTSLEVYDSPKVVAFQDSESGSKMVYSLVEPNQMKKLASHKRKKGEQININLHPLKKWSRSIVTTQFNILNAGIVFDLELPGAWQGIAAEATDAERLWLYIIP